MNQQKVTVRILGRSCHFIYADEGCPVRVQAARYLGVVMCDDKAVISTLMVKQVATLATLNEDSKGLSPWLYPSSAGMFLWHVG